MPPKRKVADKKEAGEPAPKTRRQKATKEAEIEPKKSTKASKKVAADSEKPAKKEKDTKKETSASATAKKSTETKQNQSSTNWEDTDFGNLKKNKKGKTHSLKITSWNVDGIRAWLKKGGLDIIEHDKPDIFCLQETKCSDAKLPEEVKTVEGYHKYWCSSEKEGYAGVSVYSKQEPLSVKNGLGDKEHDNEGRCITLEYDKFYLVNVYVPNAGRGLVTLPKRLKFNESFKKFIKKLDKKKPVIVCGDMNVAHNEIDLKNPKSNKKNAGFTQEERDGMTDFLGDGYIDTLREFYPDVKDLYTFWSYMSSARSKNVGWRLDYFICSQRIKDNICDSVIRDKVFGSDHCPISLFLNL